MSQMTPAQRLSASNKAVARRRKLSAETKGLADCGQASPSRYGLGCRCDACRAAKRAYSKRRATR